MKALALHGSFSP